jgi:3-dehydroquinate synthetase
MLPLMHPRVVPVTTPGGAYDVVIGAGLLPSLGPRVAALCPGPLTRAVLVHDAALPGPTVASAAESLRSAGARIEQVGLVADESRKDWASAGELLRALTACRLERDQPVVALGGGLIGDLAGFAAAVYRRGVPVIQCPTTLLAMVDASVGGKTGVNVRIGEDLLKNMAGAFHQPRLVLADVATLGSLPDRHLRAGLAECIKHALIAGSVPGAPAGMLERTRGAIAGVLARDPGVCVDIIAWSVTLKAAVVASDERETAPDHAGGRALLNLGHTFGHAVETLPGQDLLHGEAVGLGLIAAATTSQALGLAGTALVDLVRGLIRAAGLPDRLAPGADAGAILDRMGHDKKVSAGRPRLVLPREAGRAGVHADPPVEAVRAGVRAILG